jgi:glycosyltransferase involved in cell wall biosynthesis
MIVAIVANTAWNLQNFRRGLVSAILEEGHRVLLLAPDGPERDRLKTTGAVFIALRHLRRKGLNPLRDLALLNELLGIYRQQKVDVALHFTIKPVIYGSLATRLAGVRNISTLTGLGYTFLSGNWSNRIVRIMYRTALRWAEVVLFHNPDDRQLFLDGGLVTEAQSGVVAGSGIRMKDYLPVPYSEAIPGRFLFAGRLLTDKGIREYVAAARIAKAQDARLSFHVLGPLDPGNHAGIYSAELDDWIHEGVITYDGVTMDIRPHLAKASIVVLPSYREGCPRVLLEAGATGRALIGSDVPGIRDVVLNGENGWLVPARDVVGLAEVLRGCPVSLLEELGQAGRKLVGDKFCEEIVVGKYLTLIASDAF